MEGASFRFKSWLLNAPGLIHGGAYYQNFTVFTYDSQLSAPHLVRHLKLISNARSWNNCYIY